MSACHFIFMHMGKLKLRKAKQLVQSHRASEWGKSDSPRAHTFNQITGELPEQIAGSPGFLRPWGGAHTGPVTAVPSPSDCVRQCRPRSCCPAPQALPRHVCSWHSDARQAKPSLASFNSSSPGLMNSQPGGRQPVLQETFEKMKMKAAGKNDSWEHAWNICRSSHFSKSPPRLPAPGAGGGARAPVMTGAPGDPTRPGWALGED